MTARERLRRRLLSAGATLSTAVDSHREYRNAWLPVGAPQALVDEAKADGWVVVVDGDKMEWSK